MNTLRRAIFAVIVVALGIGLSGCSIIREKLGLPDYESQWIDYSGQARSSAAMQMAGYQCQQQRQLAYDQYLQSNPPPPTNQTVNGIVVPYCSTCATARLVGATTNGNAAFTNCMGAQGWVQQKVCVSRCS